MPKWKAVRKDRKKPDKTATRARSIGCIFWLVVAMAFVMWLFWAIFRSAPAIH